MGDGIAPFLAGDRPAEQTVVPRLMGFAKSYGGTMVEPVAAIEVARRLIAAIEAGDLDTIRNLYSEDVQIWHNTDGAFETRAENLRTLSWVVENLADLRYDDIVCQPTPTGFVQQHVLRATGPKGATVALPACIVATVDDGHITRLDEYLDSAHVLRLAT